MSFDEISNGLKGLSHGKENEIKRRRKPTENVRNEWVFKGVYTRNWGRT